MTKIDLYNQSLIKLGIVAAGEAADASDFQLIADKYSNLYDMLFTRQLVTWGADDPIPDEAAEPVKSMIAFLTAAEFGKNPMKYIDGALDLLPPSVAESNLRKMIAPQYVSTPAQSEYF